MRKIFATAFLLGITSVFPAQALDLSSIGQSTKPAGNSVMFQNDGENEENETSVVRQQPAEPTVPATAPAAPKPQKLFPGAVKIVAVVNGEILTTEDLENRVNAFVMNTRIPVNDQTRNMIIQRTLQAAIDEKLKLQDAEKNGIVITDKDIDQSVRFFETSNKIPQGKLRQILKDSGVSYQVFLQQMKSDLAWIRVIRKLSMAEGELTQKEIEKAQAEADRDLSTAKYMVSEILIKRKNAKNLDGLVANLRQDPRFELYAMQFSEAPSSSKGGSLGWINRERLITPLKNALGKLKPGEVSDPVKVGQDYYILKLDKIFDPKRDKAETPTQENIKKFLEERRMEEIAARHLQELRQAAVIEVRM